MRTAAAALLVLAAVGAAAAAELPSSQKIGGIFDETFQNFAPVAAPPLPQAPPSVTGKLAPGQEDETQLPAEEQQTNFQYGDISNRLKKLIIGRGKHRMAARKVNGVTVADRVKDGGIKYIVVHSAMGSCAGAIDQMETHHAAAHFIVCKDGSVTRLVDIKNITLHVKNEAVNDASVGIETETGSTVFQTIRTKRGRVRQESSIFTVDDWDPATRWRMYSSLAWLIRAVAEESGVPRDWSAGASGLAPGIFGHLDADKGIPDGHTDPGPFFYDHVYPDFETRFPGQNMTPEKYLMLLVKEDAPPKITRVETATGAGLRFSDSARAGLKKFVIYRLEGSSAKPYQTHLADDQGFPPDKLQVPAPTDPGSYRIEVYDLVGNRTVALYKVDPAAPAATLKIESVQPSADSAQ